MPRGAAARNEADRIVAVCRSRRRSAELLRLGATRVVSPEEFAADEGSFDAAYDTVGGDTRLALLTKLKPTGRLVLLGNASGQDLPISGDDIWLRSISVEGLSVGGISQSMPDRISEAASEALAASKLRPISFDVLELGQASEAHRMVEAGEGPGKIVLKIGGPA